MHATIPVSQRKAFFAAHSKLKSSRIDVKFFFSHPTPDLVSWEVLLCIFMISFVFYGVICVMCLAKGSDL